MEGKSWVLHNGYAQAEGVANLDGVPATGCLVTISLPKIRRRHRRLCALRGDLPARYTRIGVTIGAGAARRCRNPTSRCIGIPALGMRVR